MFKNKKINYLISGLNKKSGRNSRGKITVYHKGGGNKINYRIIDFKRYNKQGKVVAIQYDPNRSSFIALLYNQFENKYFSHLCFVDSDNKTNFMPFIFISSNIV